MPDNEGELQSRGYNLFHCYLTSLLQQFQAYLHLDANNGIESAAVIWGSASLSISCCRNVWHANGCGMRIITWFMREAEQQLAKPVASLPECNHDVPCCSSNFWGSVR